MIIDFYRCSGGGGGGERGPQGYQGPEGPQGPQGADGMDGKDGKDGKDGINGMDGKDGIDGAQGPQGAAGMDGKDGINGADGPQGPQGPEGAQGPAGGGGGDTYLLKSGSDVPSGASAGDVYAISGNTIETYQYDGTQGMALAKKAEAVLSNDVRQILKLTQAQYEALTVKDDATLYLIVTAVTPTAKTLVITNAPEASAGVTNGSMSGYVQGGADLFIYSSTWNDAESSADTTVNILDTAFTYTYSSSTLTITGPFSGAYDVMAEVYDSMTCLTGNTGWLTADFSSAETVTLQISITPDYDQECLCTQQGGVWDGNNCTFPNPEPEPEPEP